MGDKLCIHTVGLAAVRLLDLVHCLAWAVLSEVMAECFSDFTSFQSDVRFWAADETEKARFETGACNQILVH